MHSTSHVGRHAFILTTIFAIAAGIGPAGCGGTGDTANFCGTDEHCPDPDRPFCDTKGAYPESNGVQNVCIAAPDIQYAPEQLDASLTAESASDASLDDADEYETDSAPLADAGDPDPAKLAFDAPSVQFEEVALNSSKTAIVQTLRNKGGQASGKLSASLTGAAAGQFNVIANHCNNQNLQPGGSCTVEVEFRPTEEGLAEATLEIFSASTNKATLALTGIGIIPALLELSSASVDFGARTIDESGTLKKTITVTNVSAEIDVEGLQVALDSADFSVDSSETTCGSRLTASASCIIAVKFAPKAIGNKQASLQVSGTATQTATATVQGVATIQIGVYKTGSGRITSDKNDVYGQRGIDCGSDCNGIFAEGPITLTATPASGWGFAGWSGACENTLSKTCKLATDKSRNLSAEFRKIRPITVVALNWNMLTLDISISYNDPLYGQSTLKRCRVTENTGACETNVMSGVELMFRVTSVLVLSDIGSVAFSGSKALDANACVAYSPPFAIGVQCIADTEILANQSDFYFIVVETD